MARRANKDEDTSGRFLSGRFRSPKKLLDETSILACAIYVDLNPIRAMATTTPEESPFTSAYQRIQARQKRARRRSGSPDAFAGDAWLSPIELQAEEQSLASTQRQRASVRGFLPLKLDEYLQLLDWTGRQVCADKRGAIPAHLAPLLERLHVSASCWVDVVTGFGRWFARAVGRPPSMEAEGKRCGRNWLQGISHARQAFA